VLELEGPGPAFVLLHGYSDNAGTWRPLLRELGRRGRRALAVDLPPFGDGPLLPPLDAFVAALVRQAVDNGPPVIVGNSLGGVIGIRAAQDPELALGGTIAISPAGFGHQPWVEFFEREPLLHRIVTAPVPLPGELIRVVARVLYGRVAIANGAGVDGSVAREYASQFRGREDVVRVVRDARRVLSELHGCYDLAKLCHPVQLIWGDRDPLTPLKGAQRLIDAAPDTELTVLEGCGHCAQVDQPVRVADLATEFADWVAASGKIAS
jgi:pimeloyl-ACP methyl ester carboxylesterase